MTIFNYVTGSSTLPYSSSIPIPVSGTLITVDSVNQGFRTLADRTAFLSGSKSNLLGTNYFNGSQIFTGSLNINKKNIIRTIAIGKALLPTGITISGPGLTNDNSNTAKVYYFPLDEYVNNGSTITGWQIAQSSSANIYTTSSIITVNASGTPTVGSIIHTSGSGNYYITASNQTVQVDKTVNSYWLSYEGTNSFLYFANVTSSYTDLTEQS